MRFFDGGDAVRGSSRRHGGLTRHPAVAYRSARGHIRNAPMTTRQEAAMRYRTLGRNGPQISAIGLGCMGMSDFYGDRDGAECEATIRRALDLGVTLLDTGSFYGHGENEKLIGRTIRGVRDAVFISDKFGPRLTAVGGGHGGVDASAASVKSECEGCLQRLGVDHIDLFMLARVDTRVPIEETVGAMGALVKAGKVRHIAISEAGAQTVRRAHATFPLTAVEYEYSLWTRDPEPEILPTCRELGIGVLAFSPLGRGFFTGRIRGHDDLAADDRRHRFPRFAPDNLARNRPFAEEVEAIAREAGCTPAQLALAWLLAKGPDIEPIPGTKRVKRIEENAAAADIALEPAAIARLDALPATHPIAGPRYSPEGLAQLYR